MNHLRYFRESIEVESEVKSSYDIVEKYGEYLVEETDFRKNPPIKKEKEIKILGFMMDHKSILIKILYTKWGPFWVDRDDFNKKFKIIKKLDPKRNY